MTMVVTTDNKSEINFYKMHQNTIKNNKENYAKSGT